MCARFCLRAPFAIVAGEFDIDLFGDDAPRYNIPPTSIHPVILREAGHLLARPMQWGLVPAWAKDPSIGQKLFNARSETAHEKPSFRAAFKRRRCLIPADGFFEWKGDKGAKQPYLIEMKDSSVFGFGGLWEEWERPEGLLQTFTILTTEPNELMAEIHNRMPVIVPRDARKIWLDPEFSNGDALSAMMTPYPASEMHAFPVDRRVGNPRFDDPAAVQKVVTDLFGFDD